MDVSTMSTGMSDAGGMNMAAGMADGPHGEGHGETHGADHAALMDLLPDGAATHVAVSDGAWSDPGTWAGGRIPDAGAKVLVSEGVRVVYDVDPDTAAAARLDIVRVDGMLDFSRAASTEMWVDTLVTMPDSHLRIGSADEPMPVGVTAEIVVTGDGGAPIERSNDPEQLSRGVVTHGKVEIAGAAKSAHLELAGDALAGADRLVLAEDAAAAGWAVGDQIVLAGTGGSGDRFGPGSHDDNTRFFDEVLEITAIDGHEIAFVNRSNDAVDGDTVLAFDHARPEGFEAETAIHVGNLTRNVTVRSETGPDGPIEERGHVMLMHNPEIDVSHAAFVDLGRSDKSQDRDDVGMNPDGSDGGGTNVAGRYGLHIHRTGADDLDGRAANIEGVAVHGSPGWGLVHHDSHANLTGNFVFDVAGAGIIAEAGNEIGSWTDNLTIKMTGARDEFAENGGRLFDFGFRGEGYWVQGAAQVEMVDNVAASSAGAAINIFSGGAVDLSHEQRDADTVPIAVLGEDRQDLADAGVDGPLQEIDVTDAPLKRLEGFEAYNADVGIEMWGGQKRLNNEVEFDRARGQDEVLTAHNEAQVIEDFTLWDIRSRGTEANYVSNLRFEDGLVLGREGNDADEGIVSNNAAEDVTLSNTHVEGFGRGMRVVAGGDAPFLIANGLRPEDEEWFWDQFRIEGSSFVDNVQDIFFDTSNPFDATHTGQEFASYVEVEDTVFDAAEGNAAPEARFTAERDGRLVRLDATASADPDKAALLSGDPLGNGIASYAWDIGNDGTIDAFGRDAVASSAGGGAVDVRLVVMDAQGATGEAVQRIDLPSDARSDALADVELADARLFDGEIRVEDAGRWSSSGVNVGPDGASFDGFAPGGARGLATIVESRGGHLGSGDLVLDVASRDGDGQANTFDVEVWGIDGLFEAGTADPAVTGEELRIGRFDVDRRADALVNETVTLADGEQEIALDMGLGAEGYDWLLVRMTTDGEAVNAAGGDEVTLRDAALAVGPGEGAAATVVAPPRPALASEVSPEPEDAAPAPAPEPADLPEPEAAAPEVVPVEAAPTSEPTFVPAPEIAPEPEPEPMPEPLMEPTVEAPSPATGNGLRSFETFEIPIGDGTVQLGEALTFLETVGGDSDGRLRDGIESLVSGLDGLMSLFGGGALGLLDTPEDEPAMMPMTQPEMAEAPFLA